jgi:hypothetical protein
MDIEYASFPSNEIYIRAVVSSQLKSQNKKLPAFLTARIGQPSINWLIALFSAKGIGISVTKNGFRVTRFELRSYGDSEGEDYRTTDFRIKVQDNLAALDYLIKRNPELS